jgi:uncharacterized membrane protein
MKVRPLVVVGGAIVMAMLVTSAWAWPQIPADARIPLDWGPSGEVTGYGPKWLGLLGLPAGALGLVALLLLVPRIEPRRANLARSAPAYLAIGTAGLGLIGAIHFAIVLVALGNEVDISAVALIGSGVLCAVVGNFLGKTRSNWFFGIRTPWTLTSELSWTRTHRLGGWVFLAAGVLVVLTTLLLGSAVALWVMFGTLGIGLVAVFAYSYLVWRDDPARERTGATR